MLETWGGINKVPQLKISNIFNLNNSHLERRDFQIIKIKRK